MPIPFQIFKIQKFMNRSTFLFALLGGAMGISATANAADVVYMEKATLMSPDSYKVSMAPSTVDVSWDNQPIELIDPVINDWDEEVVTAFVTLDEGVPMEVSAGILSSFGDDGDLWELSVALYELDELWDFTGKEITVTLPEGIVKNSEGDINPEQEFVFTIVETYTKYTISPETGSTLTTTDAIVKVSFGGNELTYEGGDVTVYVYEPDFIQYTLEYGKEVTLSKDNEVVIDLNSIPASEGTEVSIPEGMFSLTVGGEENITPNIWLEYNIKKGETDKIETLDSGNNNYPVYNLNGVKVGESSEGSLVPGIYVINGKKVMVK